MKSIANQHLNLPGQAPLMVLPRTHLFPQTLLPLYIFERRYREMLSWSLQQDRMFAIATMKPGVSEARTPDDFYDLVGLGLVRACVGRDDGTSNLILLGLARMQIVGFSQDTPFRIAKLREAKSPPLPSKKSEDLIGLLRDACAFLFTGDEKLPEPLSQQLEQIDDPAVLCDVIAHACLRDAVSRQLVFEELDITHRVALLLGFLQEEGPHRGGGD